MTARTPQWSGNRERYRLSRTGNRRLNLALHRIAIAQARYHPDATPTWSAAARPGTPAPSPSASSSAGFPTSSTEP
ncbi:transposase [Actinacidiphila bryophytorum]|uniref:Transposase IS116/IS110/IS902 C-terminal domain-containing protein n=1 Tax=Actinacidiphila bryophytorum TaxID=1436133 RepID=A0A9W4ECT7_9ACTN|nr:transposase [Actinacidiphila bryophytorum]MBN6544686.1 transposase [Actinacidiphila bryophytorum]CAG7615817.1 hypothetical protein SBRY_110110 [Actinacidiphila bryophytorum]